MPRLPPTITHRLTLVFIGCIMTITTACGSDNTNPTATADGFKPQVILLASATPAAPKATVAPPTLIPATLAPTTATPPTLAAGSNPFTGLPLDEAALNRRPIIIKVANTIEIRPQSNLATADIVTEHYAEGGVTRFSALFLTHAPDQIGSVRSCRLIDIELPKIFDAAIVCSGTSPGVKPLMRESWGFQNHLTMISDFGPYECASCPMFRTANRAPPHNLFANANNVWNELDKRGNNQPTLFKSWVFDAALPTQGRSMAGLKLAYSSGVVGWDYDKAAGLWGRTLAGRDFEDAATGQQVTAANVLVVTAFHAITLIQEDATGSKSIQIQLWGEGPLKVFRDGKMIEGTWQRNGDVGMFELRDANGQMIPLKPGNTWIQLVPGDLAVTTK